jgi:uncharacterized protein (UPF0332 family)
MFSLHFVKNGAIELKLGEFYSAIFDMRLSGDYSDFFVIDTEEVLALVEPTTELIFSIESILSIKSE